MRLAARRPGTRGRLEEGPCAGSWRRRAFTAATVLLVTATLAGCDDGAGLDPDAIRVEGTVTRLHVDSAVAGAVLTLDVLGPGGSRAWGTGTTDETGAYAVEVGVPGGCAGDSIDAVLRVSAVDHAERVRGGPDDAFRLACGEPTTVDLELYRTAFRTPQPVAGGLVPTQLSAGRFHACALTAGGAYCWGSAGSGRLGNGSVEGTAGSPVPVTNGEAFVQVSAGSEHTCAVDDAGAAWCWGDNFWGQVGADISIRDVGEPFRVQGELQFVQVQAGRFHSCGLTADGAVYCWGDARSLGLGDDVPVSYGEFYLTPQPVALEGTYVEISSLFSSTCARRDTGALWCWGFSYDGELGAGESVGWHLAPLPVAGSRQWSDVSAGVIFGCGLTTAGAAYCWGQGAWGRLGDGGEEDSAVPVAVAGGRSYATVVAAEMHACALTDAGEAYCWGGNESGELGTPAAEDEACTYGPCATTPVAVPTDLRFTGLSGGHGFTCGITTGQALVCWGQRSRLGSGRPLGDPSADIAAGGAP